jgi:hypothetical protein
MSKRVIRRRKRTPWVYASEISEPTAPSTSVVSYISSFSELEIYTFKNKIWACWIRNSRFDFTASSCSSSTGCVANPKISPKVIHTSSFKWRLLWVFSEKLNAWHLQIFMPFWIIQNVDQLGSKHWKFSPMLDILNFQIVWAIRMKQFLASRHWASWYFYIFQILGLKQSGGLKTIWATQMRTISNFSHGTCNCIQTFHYLKRRGYIICL